MQVLGRRPGSCARLLRYAPAIFVMAASIGPAAALEVTRSRTIAAPPAAVWSLIGGFCDIARWHPEVEGCTLADRSGVPVRAIVARGGLGTIIERQTMRDEAAMRYAYSFVSGPLPVKTYDATISVAPAAEGTTVTWVATFEASGMTDAEALADIAGVYEAGLAGIAKEVAR